MRLTSVFALSLALVAAVVMLMTKPTQHGPSASAASEVTLQNAYPGKQPQPVKGTLADGAQFNPVYFIDAQRGLGTAPGPEGAVRLILRTPEGERQLRSLPKAQTPEFAGFASKDQQLVWLELTSTPDGLAETKLWAIDSLSAAPRLVTADTGDVALFDKRDDVVIHDGQVSWVAAARTETPQTEIRTVPIGGGKVKVETREGAWAFANWPWLTSVNIGGDFGPIELRNLESDERTVVGVQATELMACSPQWCRALIVGTTSASTVIELLNTRGTERFRAASGSVAASIVDVALLDRFEVYSYAGGKLVLFDLQERKSIVVAQGVSQVASRGAVLWWSTGDNETTAWHVLDLRSLIK